MKAIATLALLCCLTLPATPHAQTPAASQADASRILARDQAGPLMPPSVFFDGQIATVQTRNSAALRLGGNKIFLAGLVDSSGYSSGVRDRYQGIFLLTAPSLLAGKRLAPGAYGFGFLGDQMAVMDLGANDILRAPVTQDPTLKRPMPLQILPDAAHPTGARLYLGRSFVLIEPAP